MLFLSACSSAPAALPTVTPFPVPGRPFPTDTATPSGTLTPSPLPTTTAIAITTTGQRIIFACPETTRKGFADSMNLRLCEADPSGANRRVVVEQLRSNIVRSPDDQWLAFALRSNPQDIMDLYVRLYRLRIGETIPTPLTPDWVQYNAFYLLKIDNNWLYVRAWDGSVPSDAFDRWHYFKVPLTGGEPLPIEHF